MKGAMKYRKPKTKKLEVFNIKFSYGVSRGRDTAGYRIVRLHVNGEHVASTNGGGYDMHGTVLGQWITKAFQDRIQKLPANYGSMDKNEGFYGLTHHVEGNPYGSVHKLTAKQRKLPGTRSAVNGMCGQSAVYSIMEAIGVGVREIGGKR